MSTPTAAYPAPAPCPHSSGSAYCASRSWLALHLLRHQPGTVVDAVPRRADIGRAPVNTATVRCVRVADIIDVKRISRNLRTGVDVAATHRAGCLDILSSSEQSGCVLQHVIGCGTSRQI